MTRTWDPQIRNLVLYPTELPGRYGLRLALLDAQYTHPDCCAKDERRLPAHIPSKKSITIAVGRGIPIDEQRPVRFNR